MMSPEQAEAKRIWDLELYERDRARLALKAAEKRVRAAATAFAEASERAREIERKTPIVWAHDDD